MVLSHPQMIWLLAIVPLIAAAHVRHRTGLPTGRIVLTAGVRVLAVAALALALSGPLVPQAAPLHEIAVIDISASMSDGVLDGVRTRVTERWSRARGDGTEKHIVLFDRQARAADASLLTRPVAEWRQAGQLVPGSALAEALDLAAGLVPGGAMSRVTLFSDGLATGADARTAAVRLGARGIQLTAECVGQERKNDVVLVRADLPATTGIGATVPLRLVMDAAAPGTVEVVVRDVKDESPVRRFTRSLVPGRQHHLLPVELTREGLQEFEVAISSSRDDVSENNRRSVATLVSPPYRVRVVETDPQQRAAQAIRSSLGLAAHVESRPVPLAADDVADADLLVLADVPAAGIPQDAQSRICTSVREGLGLLVTGGRQSLGPGGYDGTELATVLPVDFKQELERRDPSVTLVIIIDTSGSMTGPRIALAKEVARLAVRRLQPHDKVGIVEFYGTKRWAARIQSAANGIDINRALNRLSAGGGTVVLPAIEEAYYALLNVQTRFRHVLIITDGGVETGPFQEIITRMAEAGITASTIMVGPGQHSTFLSSLAHWGNGRFYSAPDRFHLPEVILKQPEQLLASPFRERPAELQAAAKDPALDDVDFASAPPLAGYVSAAARPEADVLLHAPNGDPLLTRWRHGAGYAAVWASDLGGEWSKDLASWPGLARVLSNLGRQMAPRSDQLRIEPIVRPGGIELAVNCSGGRSPSDATSPVRVTWTSPDGRERSRDLPPIRPGQWNDLLGTDLPGVHRFAAEIEGGPAAGSGAIALNADQEISAVTPDREFLETLSRLAAESRVSAPTQVRAEVYWELWPWLALAAVALTLLQLLVRRVPVRTVASPVAAGWVLIAIVPVMAGRAFAEPTSQPIAQTYNQSQTAAWDGKPEQARQILEAQLPKDVTGETHAALAEWREVAGDDAGAIELLRKAVALQSDPTALSAWRARLSILLLESGKTEEGCRILLEAARVAPSDEYRRFHANLAILFGQPSTASAIQASTAAETRDLLLQALAARRADDTELAERLCRKAAEQAQIRQDERFSLQQWVSIARQRKRLDALADEMLRESDLRESRVHLLVNVLRELNRVDDLIGLVERLAASTPEPSSAGDLSDIQDQVVAAAVEAGKYEAAVRMLEGSITRSPQEMRWRIALARLHLLHGDRQAARTPLLQAMPLATQPADLFELADAARDLAVVDVAEVAVDQAAKMNDDAAFQAGLWRAQLAEKQGDISKAILVLEKASGLARDQVPRLRELAKAFERYKQPGRAIELLRRVLERVPDDDAQLRLAWLLEETQQFEAARDLWQAIWQSSPTPALTNQAAARLLELSAKTGTIADLAIAMEDKLGEGRATPRELSLLVDLYTQLGDDLSASEILFAFARKSGDELGSLRQLANAYVRMGRLAQADTTLEQLAAKDPANELEHLQERNVLAVERQRPEDAITCIERMSSLGTDTTIEEMSAGVYSLLGDHEKAAQCYERVLAEHPQEVEVWLLWANAMRDAGQADRAIQRLQVLANQAEQDDLFLVAVDALLNLDAGSTPLKVALRRLLERVAADPRKIFLYDAAADVMDTLGQAGRINPLMEQALVFAGDQRGLLLREMMERAKADGRKDLHIEYGALLVGLDYDVPPQVLIELGETFLAQDRRSEADRAFTRACSLGDYATVRQKVADAYDRALLPQPAQQITARLLITDPDNVGLLYRDAGLLEQIGRFEEAFSQYERALRLLVGRMPRFRATTTGSAPADSPPRRTQRVAANVDETTQYLDPTVDSLAACARTEALQHRVIDLLESIVKDELQARPEAKEGRSLGHFPRLERMAEHLRSTAVSLHQPEVAEKVDRELLACFPGDAALAGKLAAAWIDWGLGQRAAGLVASATAKPPPKIAAQAIRTDQARLEAFLAAAKPDDPVLRLLLPALLMDGRVAEARRLITGRAESSVAVDLPTARLLLIAAVATGDPGLTGQRLVGYLEACKATPDGDRITPVLAEGLRLGWNSIGAEQRPVVVEALDRLAGQYSPRSTRVDLVRLRLAPEAASAEQRRAVLSNAARLASTDERAFISLLQWVTPQERLLVLEQAWAAAKPTQQLDLLLAAAGAWTWQVDQAAIDVLNRLLDACPTARLDKFTPYGTLTRSAWHRNDRQPELGEAIAEHLLGQLGTEVAVRTAAACALASAGKADQAVELGRQAWSALVAGRKLEPEHERMIDDLVRCFSYERAQSIISTNAATRPVDDASTVECFAMAKVEARGEREEEAVEYYSQTLRRAPTSETVRRAVMEYLQQTGRITQLPPLFEPFLADRSVVQGYEIGRIADAYRLLGRPRDALRVFAHDSGTLSAIRTLELEAMLGRTDRLELILRRYLVTNRLERRFYTPLAARPPGIGGMLEYLARTQAESPRSFSLFNLLANVDAAIPEFESLWRTAAPDRRDVPGLVEALGQAASRSAEGRPDPLKQLEAWATTGSLHARDMAMLTWLIVQSNAELSPEAARLLREGLSWLDADQVDGIETRARLCLQAGDADGARSILRWAMAVDLATGRNLLDGAAPVRRMDLYLSCVPPEERTTEARRVTGAWAALPLEEPNDRLDALVLRRAGMAGDSELAQSTTAAALWWLDAMPSQAFMPRLERACARAFFESGKTDAALRHVARLVRLCRTAYGEIHPLDAMQFLPSANRLKDAPATVQAVTAMLDKAQASGDLSPTHATRSLALLGHWCVSQKLIDQAASLLERVRAVAGPTPCERWLWVIDLAKELDSPVGIEMETQLRAAGLLPILRDVKTVGSAPS